MPNRPSGNRMAVLVLSAAMMLGSAGWVLGSSMAFKFNKLLYPQYLIAEAPKRENWISLPYSNPYSTAKALCNAMGSASASTSVFQFNPVTGTALVNFPCSLSTSVPLHANRGVRLRVTASAPSNLLLVGGHDENVTLPDIVGGFTLVKAPMKENWISVPYHTVWQVAEDVCQTLQLCGTCPAGPGSVTRIEADPNISPNVITHPCGTGIKNFSLVVGEAIVVRKNSLTGGNCNGGADICNLAPPHL